MRVLVVDDDPSVRAVARVMLEAGGVEVAEACGGVEALREFRRTRADVVLCDLFMPDHDGLQVIRELRDDFPDLKIVAMSGGGYSGTVDMLPTARLLGANSVLHKPFTQVVLLAEVRQVFEKEAR